VFGKQGRVSWGDRTGPVVVYAIERRWALRRASERPLPSRHL